MKDYECHCGKYKRIRYKGIVCDRCGVEVTEKRCAGNGWDISRSWFRWLISGISVRCRRRSDTCWVFRRRRLEAIVYYERYVVVQAGAAAVNGVSDLDLLAEKEYLDILNALPKGNQQLDDSDPDKFIAQMGAEAIYTLLQRVDLDELFPIRCATRRAPRLRSSVRPKRSNACMWWKRSASRARSTSPSG